MKVVYALQPLQKSIFLAGPTPRTDIAPDWRPAAIALLQEKKFDGLVFSPVPEDGSWSENYDSQVTWEWEALGQATVTLFWVPRELLRMPAFTTNIEFGFMAGKGQIVLGYPEYAPKMRYLHSLADRYHYPVTNDLEDAVELAIHFCEKPFAYFW